MENIIFTRKELYELVWSTPVTTILKKYKLKTHEFSRLCTKMNIPLPSAGHWQKLKANKSVIIKQLPEDNNALDIIELISSGGKDDEKISDKIQKKIETELGSPLVVPDRLLNPDKLIEITAKKLMIKDGYLENGLRVSAWDTLDIKVSPKNVNRALRFMDFFIKVMRKRGHSFCIEGKETYIIVAEEKIKVLVREKLKKIKSEESWRNLKPTGILCFKAERFSYRKEWHDGRIKLEKHLSKIISEIERKANELRAQILNWEARKAIQKEQEKIKAERQKLKEQEIADIKNLFQEAKRWKMAILLREYLYEVEKNIDLENKDSKKWLDWATSRLNWYDPFIEEDDELLENVDRDSLKIYD